MTGTMNSQPEDSLDAARRLVEEQVTNLRNRSASLTETLAAQHEALRNLEQRWSQGRQDIEEALERALLINSQAGKRALAVGRHLPRLKTRLDDLFRAQETEEARRQRLEMLYAVIAAVNSSLDLDEVLSLVMNAIVRVTGAERAFLMLRDSAGQFTPRAAHNLDLTMLEAPAFEISRSVVERVATQGQPIITTNAQEDPRFSAQASVVSFSLRSILCVPIRLRGAVNGVVYADNRIRAGVFSSQDRDLLAALADQAAVAIENARLFAETRQRLQEMNAVYDVSQSITRTLDMERVLQQITEESIRAVPPADKAVLHLLDASGKFLEPKAVAPATARTGKTGHLPVDRGLAGVALRERRTLRVPDIRDDPRFAAPRSDIRSLLVVPLVVVGQAIGTLTVDSKRPKAFTAGNERLLGSLASQVAIAIENARLFASLKQKIDEITTMKNYMEDIFSSVASGVITTDLTDRITTFNPAAERILHVSGKEVLQKPLRDALSFLLDSALPRQIERIKRESAAHLSYELERNVPRRGDVSLRLHLSPLRDAAQRHTGVAIVLDDLTEQRALEHERERIRQMFQLYVAPSVVERLLADSSQLRLGGTRQEVTIFFADIRGFSTFSHTLSPEQLVDTLNDYLALATDAILAEEGTLDKFMGDAVMAIFNAPLPQAAHPLRAVRAALRFQQAIVDHHRTVAPERRLSFGVGIATGQAVVGNVGTKQVRNYTAIGDSVNLAKRLQENAKAGQILLDATAYRRVRPEVEARRLPPLTIKGWDQPVEAYDLLSMVEDRPQP